MRLRETTIQARQTTVYTSKTPARQKRFSTRVKAVRQRPHRLEGRVPQLCKQQTLTQLDFPALPSSRSNPEPAENFGEDEWEAPRSKKRRKRNRAEEEAEIRRQQRLTQMRGFLRRNVPDSETEEDLSEMETDGAVSGATDQSQHEEPGWHMSFREDTSTQYQAPKSHSSASRSQRRVLSSPTKAVLTGKPSPSTPAKCLKREIASSQSPFESPLSTNRATPVKSQRTPLQEIHPNILAQRDSASPSKKPKFRGNAIVQDSLADDSDLDCDENLDPNDIPQCGPIKTSCSASLPRKRIRLSSPVTPRHEDTVRTSQASTVSLSPSPFKRPPLPAHARAMPSSPMSQASSAGSSPSAASPLNSTTSPFKRPPLPPHAIARRDSGSVSPSPSPRSSAPQQHQQHSVNPVARPPPLDSQWGINLDSQHAGHGDVELDDVSPLPVINDSADIVTASQLCPKSSLE